ncbi:MAG TPA: hypothetical protein VNA20_05485 [Frankiaceae bacterium]|nr:hypothetical protein [Frankiaceae bacterium]
MRSVINAVIAAAVCVAADLVAFSVPATAAPPIAGGDCWRSATPLWCRGTFVRDEFLKIYTLDRFSDQRPNWGTAYSTSNSNWTGAYGPQTLTTYRRERDSWVFYEDSTTGKDGLRSVALATTWNCDYGGYCSRHAEPMIVRFSSIKLNRSTLSNDSGTLTTGTFAHETGHALGLAHHPTSTDLMYAGSNSATSPSSHNIGVLPPCSGSDTTTNAGNIRAGVRCIYKWKS